LRDLGQVVPWWREARAAWVLLRELSSVPGAVLGIYYRNMFEYAMVFISARDWFLKFFYLKIYCFKKLFLILIY
jgi:hypothetical protein